MWARSGHGQDAVRFSGIYALRVASVSSIKCSPTWPGPWMCAGVHDRPVRRLLAWLLALSAWDAGEPQVRRCFRLRHGRLRLVWWPSEGVGARGGAPEKLIKMATGQRRRHLRLEAAVPAARCSIALLSRRPSLSRFPSCLRRCSQGFSPSAMSAVAGPDSSANREERGQLRRELRRRVWATTAQPTARGQRQCPSTAASS